MKKYKYISFFSGALGLDLGLKRAGFDCLSVNENNKKALETIKKNKFKELKKIYDLDINELNSSQILEDLSIKKRELFAVVGGPPCQSFSTNGKRKGFDDIRGNSFLKFLEIATEIEPKFIVIENVRGLLSSPLKNKDKEIKGGTLFKIISFLESKGYGVNFNLYDMSNFGVPQQRERLIILAHRDGLKIPDIEASFKKVNLREALHNVVSQSWINFSKKRLKFFQMLKAGENWKNLPSEKIKKEAMGNSYYSGGGKTGFFRRLDWNKPSPTLLTNPTMNSTSLCHPQEDRPLSIEEYLRIQTFPDNYSLGGSILDQYRQLGNAIPCLFGKLIGDHLIKFDKGHKIKENKHPISRYKNTSYDQWLSNYKKSLKL